MKEVKKHELAGVPLVIAAGDGSDVCHHGSRCGRRAGGQVAEKKRRRYFFVLQPYFLSLFLHNNVQTNIVFLGLSTLVLLVLLTSCCSVSLLLSSRHFGLNPKVTGSVFQANLVGRRSV